jgi:hypothetical protein
MKKQLVIACAAAAGILAMPAAANAQSGSGAETVFECTLRNGNSVRVTAQGGNLFYRYGNSRRAELALRGSARSGTVHYMQQRYASIQSQLRFTNGNYHYIVHSMGANQQSGSSSISGLVVMRGTRRVADHSCRRFTEFRAGFDTLNRLPADTEAYSVM